MWRLYFPHSGAGQSVLAQLQPNRWVVIDSKRLSGDRGNPSFDLLARARDEAPGSFELLAVVITHLHTDHYGGIPDFFDLCHAEQAADPAKGQLVIPLEQELMTRYLEAREWACDQPYLRRFLLALEDSAPKIACRPLTALRFAWPPRISGDPWVFTYQSTAEYLLGRLVRELGRLSGTALEAKLKGKRVPELFGEWRNELAYVLGIGGGATDGGFHLLLTSDVPRRAFQEMTELAQRQLSMPGFGASDDLFAISPLPREGAEARRIQPLSGLTVPHHGSRPDRLEAEDLTWWLPSETGAPSAPGFAVVQGGQNALGRETVTALHQAGLRILASAAPAKLLDGRTITDRSPAPLPLTVEEREGPGPFAFEEAAADPGLMAVGPPHLEVCGGSDGTLSIVSHGFYEILPRERKVLHLPRNVVYARLPETTPWH